MAQYTSPFNAQQLAGMSQDDALNQYKQMFAGGIGGFRPNTDMNGNLDGTAVGNVNGQGVYLRGFSSSQGDPSQNNGMYTMALSDPFDQGGEAGKYGQYMGQFDSNGKFMDAYWKQNQRSDGWFGENLSTIGPALVLGAAGLGSMFGGELAGAAGGAAGGAPISASPISSLGSAATWGDIGAAAGQGSFGMAAQGALGKLGLGAVAQQALGGGGGKGGLEGLVASLAGAYSQNRQGDYQSDLAGQLMDQRQFFLDRLMQSYDNPNSFLEGPEFQAIQDTTLNRLQRQDAAKGRLANDTGRQALMQKLAFEQLGQYRQGLASSSGLGGSPLDIGRTGLSGLANELGTLNGPLSVLGRSAANGGFNVDDFVSGIFNLGEL